MIPPRALLCLPLVATGCLVPSVQVIPRVSNVDLSGDVGAMEDNGTVSGSATSSMESLGLDDSEPAFSPRVDLRWLGAHVSLSTLSSSFSGRGTLEGNIELGDIDIPAMTDVDSSFDLDAFSGAITWDVFPTDLMEIGLGLGVTLLDFDIEFDPVNDTIPGVGTDTAQTDESVPVPLLVGRVGSQVGPFDLGLVVAYMEADTSGVDASFTDIDLHAAYRLLGEGDRFVGYVVAGYRSLRLDAEYEDDDSNVIADFDLAGPYVGVMLSF